MQLSNRLLIFNILPKLTVVIINRSIDIKLQTHWLHFIDNLSLCEDDKIIGDSYNHFGCAAVSSQCFL